MPAPISTALLAFGAVLTSVCGVAGVAVAALGLLVEAILFYTSGLDAS